MKVVTSLGALLFGLFLLGYSIYCIYLGETYVPPTRSGEGVMLGFHDIPIMFSVLICFYIVFGVLISFYAIKMLVLSVKISKNKVDIHQAVQKADLYIKAIELEEQGKFEEAKKIYKDLL